MLIFGLGCSSLLRTYFVYSRCVTALSMDSFTALGIKWVKTFVPTCNTETDNSTFICHLTYKKRKHEYITPILFELPWLPMKYHLNINWLFWLSIILKVPFLYVLVTCFVYLSTSTRTLSIF